MVSGRGEHAEVIPATAARVKARVLQHGAHMGTRVRELAVPTAGEGRGASVRVDQAEQHSQGRALARTVRAEEARHLAGIDGEAQVVDRLHGSEVLAQAVDLDRRAHRPTIRILGFAVTSVARVSVSSLPVELGL